ncbi:MAG: DsbA family protein [Coxiellaceae bacterium]|nr:DsbA family protein [Coxiellaceae bacterium]
MKLFRLITVLTCLTVSLFSLSALAQNGSGSFSPSQVKEIQKIVHDYLISNPEVLVQASQALQQQQAAAAQKSAMDGIKGNADSLFNDPKTPTVGNANAPVEVVEFFDYQCGHCKIMAPVIESVVKNNSNVKVIFKELPIFGGNSRYAAKAALASVAQGKYYKFHNALFAAKSQLDPQTVMKIAKNVGLDTSKLKTAMNAPWVNQQIRDNFQLAQKLKLMGTPAFIISNSTHTKFRFIPGSTSKQNFKQQIAAVSQ